MPTHSDSFFCHRFEWVDWGAWKSRMKTSSPRPKELLILFNSTDMICTHNHLLSTTFPTHLRKKKKRNVVIIRDNLKMLWVFIWGLSLLPSYTHMPASHLPAMMEAQNTIGTQQQYELQIHVYLSAQPILLTLNKMSIF